MGGDQFLLFRNCDGGEKSWKNETKGMAQPNIKKVRQVSVTDVVVVGRIGRDDFAGTDCLGLCVGLTERMLATL